jgi:membrane protein
MSTRDQQARPIPDEAELEDSKQPQPEREEPRLDGPVGMSELSTRDWFAVAKRAGKESLADNIPMIAQALAYASFLAIPSALLVAVGVFTLFASPDTITNLMNSFGSIVPAQTTDLLGGSLQRLSGNSSASLTMTIVGFVLALWTTTSAMNTYMTGLNMAYDRDDSRSFLKKRAVALAMVACVVFAFALVAVLLIFGPPIEHWIGQRLGMPTLVSWVWWIAQWPLLVAGLLAAFATLLYLGPDVDHPRWQLLTPGALVAVVVWLAASGAFAFYTATFSSYNKTWGALAAVIIMLTWLWLTGLALLFGAEVNSETERSRELRRGEPAGNRLQAPRSG